MLQIIFGKYILLSIVCVSVLCLFFSFNSSSCCMMSFVFAGFLSQATRLEKPVWFELEKKKKDSERMDGHVDKHCDEIGLFNGHINWQKKFFVLFCFVFFHRCPYFFYSRYFIFYPRFRGSLFVLSGIFFIVFFFFFVVSYYFYLIFLFSYNFFSFFIRCLSFWIFYFVSIAHYFFSFFFSHSIFLFNFSQLFNVLSFIIKYS